MTDLSRGWRLGLRFHWGVVLWCVIAYAALSLNRAASCHIPLIDVRSDPDAGARRRANSSGWNASGGGKISSGLEEASGAESGSMAGGGAQGRKGVLGGTVGRLEVVRGVAKREELALFG